ncbi:YheC/YheD family protein [Bacillus sp. IITD106]|nr:YheC/YheD family protein [Bacillus sp. IITD106]
MRNVFKVVMINSQSYCLFAHANQSKLIDKTTTIHFGFQKMKVVCKQLDTLKENEIGLSKTVIDKLQLPLEAEYELSLENNRIVIGPFIGLLVANYQSELKEKVKYLTFIIRQYPLVRGVIAAFSLEGMDEKNAEINGYIYNPSSRRWEKGTFPFPAVVVKRMLLPTKGQHNLKKLYGSRFFNSAYINKWKMYQLLSTNKDLLPHLPKTYLYKKPEDILHYLKSFGTIYVKSLSGLKGTGVTKFIAEPKKYSVKFRSNKENKTIDFFSENELLYFVRGKFKSGNYVIQQEIDLEIEKNHLIDFRIVLIKNENGQWEDVGMVGRKGVKGSIVSNRSSGGIVERGETLLLESFNLSNPEMLSYRRKMSEIAIKAAKQLDKYESIYKYGVDIGIDRHHHIWLIEVNNHNPNDNIFLHVGDYDKGSKIKDSSMLYAKYLAGFPKNRGSQ